MQPLLLASSSKYRHALLAKLGLPFTWAPPEVDESPMENESADALVRRLATAKTHALAAQHSDKLIIGSDQVAVLEGRIIGKPHTRERAITQLQSASGKSVIFKTGLCLLNAQTGRQQIVVEEFKVNFNTLSNAQIEHYLDYEEPFDCAGSFKCEGLGIALFSRLEGKDPNSLVGLPLISLVAMLRNEGIDPLLMAAH